MSAHLRDLAAGAILHAGQARPLKEPDDEQAEKNFKAFWFFCENGVELGRSLIEILDREDSQRGKENG